MNKYLCSLLSYMCFFALVVAFGLISTPCRAQASNDSLFVEYLLEKKQYSDIIQWTAHRPQLPYHRAVAFYSQTRLDSAIRYFEQVPMGHPQYLKSQFLQSFSHAFRLRLSKAKSVINRLELHDSLHIELRTYELAAIALLERDTLTAGRLQHQLTDSYFAISEQAANLQKTQQLVSRFKPKSATVAGVLSAIVPGSGKIYAGKLGQGLMTFIQNVAFGLQAFEAYRRDGWRSPRFLVYGGLFTFFYVGNVWGSALSVHVRRQEFNDKINEQILFDMHIPLRTIFNQ